MRAAAMLRTVESGKGEGLKPHIPLGRRKGPADDERPREVHDQDNQDSSLYCIYDENNNPLVIDLQAIDDCQRLREVTPFESLEESESFEEAEA